MSKIFCGIKQPPKNSRLGTMKECAEAKQVRQYGVKKIDARLLEVALGKKQDPNSRTNLQKDISKMKGRERLLRGKLAAAKGDKKAPVKDELNALIRKINEAVKKFNKLPRSNSRTSRSRSRRSRRSRRSQRSRRSRSRRSQSRSKSRRSRSRKRSRRQSRSRSRR